MKTGYRGYQLRQEAGGLVISFFGEDIDTVPDMETARRVIDEWMWCA